MIGRAAGRDRADELRDLALNELAIPAVAGALDGHVIEMDTWRRNNLASLSSTHRDHRHFFLEPHLGASRNVNALIFFNDVQHLIGVAAHRCRRFDDAHGDRLAAKHASRAQFLERGDDRHALDYAL